ncbi:hypothetical protein [Streptomyces sp. NBC_01589]|uniref:hypothetical protein n=1 Tax=unclassified Streptomyces TaxID=2593676 RepID=UPI00386D3663
MSNYVNTQSMQPFGVKFAKEFRLLDHDEYGSIRPTPASRAATRPRLSSSAK